MFKTAENSLFLIAEFAAILPFLVLMLYYHCVPFFFDFWGVTYCEHILFLLSVTLLVFQLIF